MFRTSLRTIAVKRISTRFSRASVRFNSSLKKESEVKPVYTKLSEENDPERNLFFKYTWGTWLKNDKQEREKRFTAFSIKGLNQVIQNLNNNVELNDSKLSKPVKNSDTTVTFKENIKDLIGESKEDGKIFVKTMSSIHEGKHNRVYKVSLNNDKNLVLRIPYKLLTEYGTSRQIQSEAATIDFARYKLGLNVPKLLAYGMHSLNPLKSPFMLMEYLEGDLLMKQWNPSLETSDPKHKEELKKVIDPLSKLQEKLLSVEFNQFGSLYFFDDVSPILQNKGEPYSGETDENLKNRWRIGLSTDRNLWRNKELLKPDQFNPNLGPNEAKNPHKVVEDAINMELENLRTRLSLSDAGTKVEDAEKLKKIINVYEKFSENASKLLNETSSAIPKSSKLFAPRLSHPDIDPMNTIVTQNGLYFVDFENVAIKPFIYSKSPDFVNYDGFKIYNLQDIPDFDKLPEQEQYEYTLMHKRSRNQFLWEFALNENNKDLVVAMSPYIKELRSPYTLMLMARDDDDYLFVQEALLKIGHNWKAYAESGLVKDDGTKTYPIKWSDEKLQDFEKDFTNHQKSLMQNPFASTQGWMPQDTFEQLLGNGLIEKVGDEYKLKDMEALFKQ